jgi:hypothetical protein
VVFPGQGLVTLPLASLSGQPVQFTMTAMQQKHSSSSGSSCLWRRHSRQPGEVCSLFSYLFSLLDTSSDGLKSIFAIALALLLAVVPTRAQPPQMTPGFGGAPQEGSNDPAESSAYGAALAQPDPASRIVALRHFIVNYPNSSMRQSAISQLMLAQRQTRGGGVSSLGTTPHMTVAQPGPTSAPLPAEPLPIQGVPA